MSMIVIIFGLSFSEWNYHIRSNCNQFKKEKIRAFSSTPQKGQIIHTNNINIHNTLFNVFLPGFREIKQFVSGPPSAMLCFTSHVNSELGMHKTA